MRVQVNRYQKVIQYILKPAFSGREHFSSCVTSSDLMYTSINSRSIKGLLQFNNDKALRIQHDELKLPQQRLMPSH